MKWFECIVLKYIKKSIFQNRSIGMEYIHILIAIAIVFTVYTHFLYFWNYDFRWEFNSTIYSISLEIHGSSIWYRKWTWKRENL